MARGRMEQGSQPGEPGSRAHALHLFWTSLPRRMRSVQFSRSAVSDSLRPHEPQHARPPCPLPIPGVYPNPCPLSWWCHPTIPSSVVPFSSCLQSFPASRSFQMSQFFASGGQSIGVTASASVLPLNIQDWFPLGWTGWISLQSKGLSRAFSNITVQMRGCMLSCFSHVQLLANPWTIACQALLSMGFSRQEY